MFAVRRGARLARPLSLIGVGCAGQYAYSRDESFPQLAVGTAATCWSQLMASAELLRVQDAHDALPQEGKAASSELRIMADFVSQCAASDADSALLRLAVLRRIGDIVKTDPRGSAVLGLVPDELDNSAGNVHVRGCASLSTRARRELVALLDDTATALALTASKTSKGSDYKAEASTLLIATLRVLTSESASWHRELGADGVVRVAHAAALAATWLGDARRHADMTCGSDAVRSPQLADSKRTTKLVAEDAKGTPKDAGNSKKIANSMETPPSSPDVPCLPTDEDALCEVWRAIGCNGVLARALGSRASPQPENAARRSALLACLEAHHASPAPPPLAAARPVRDFLSAKLQDHINDAHDGGHDLANPQSSTLRRLIKLSLVVTVAGSAILAVSQDGMGLCDFRAVPDSWRPSLESLVANVRASAGGAGSVAIEPSADRASGTDNGCASVSSRLAPVREKFQDFVQSFRQRN